MEVGAMFDRITFKQEILGGRACIRGMRIPVSAVATYNKPAGPWEYWRGKITSVVLQA